MSDSTTSDIWKRNKAPQLAPWMIVLEKTVIDARKIASVGPLSNKGSNFYHYTVQFVGGAELLVSDNGGPCDACMKRDMLLEAWAKNG